MLRSPVLCCAMYRARPGATLVIFLSVRARQHFCKNKLFVTDFVKWSPAVTSIFLIQQYSIWYMSHMTCSDLGSAHYFECAMPRLLVSTRKRVIIFRQQGYGLKDIRRRLKEEGIVVSMRSNARHEPVNFCSSDILLD